jgi:hypothetical protein
VYTALEWNLGLLEAVLMVVPIGVTVDLVTHFAVWYSNPRNHNDKRLEKTQWAFEQGIFGVFGGAGMMFGASLFLLGSPLEFVFGFGVTLCFTLGMGLMLGMFLFLIVLGIIGPEDDDCKILCLKDDQKVGQAKSYPMTNVTSGGVPTRIVTGVPAAKQFAPGGAIPLQSNLADSSDSDSDDDSTAPPPKATNAISVPGGVRSPGGKPPAGGRSVPPRPGGVLPPLGASPNKPVARGGSIIAAPKKEQIVAPAAAFDPFATGGN